MPPVVEPGNDRQWICISSILCVKSRTGRCDSSKFAKALLFLRQNEAEQAFDTNNREPTFLAYKQITAQITAQKYSYLLMFDWGQV